MSAISIVRKFWSIYSGDWPLVSIFSKEVIEISCQGSLMFCPSILECWNNDGNFRLLSLPSHPSLWKVPWNKHVKKKSSDMKIMIDLMPRLVNKSKALRVCFVFSGLVRHSCIYILAITLPFSFLKVLQVSFGEATFLPSQPCGIGKDWTYPGSGVAPDWPLSGPSHLLWACEWLSEGSVTNQDRRDLRKYLLGFLGKENVALLPNAVGRDSSLPLPEEAWECEIWSEAALGASQPHGERWNLALGNIFPVAGSKLTASSSSLFS